MFYAINKPKNISSFNEIKKFANENNIKKIGHCGTLDPLASGLLIVATNEHTKLIDYIYSNYKCYKVNVKLHFSSPSYDEGSEVSKLNNNISITKKALLKALRALEKTKTQIPPIFSAKKINGIRAYEYARKNKEINLKSINIDIKWLRLISFNKKNQTFIFKCNVSKGTYIRSLVHDLGLTLKTDAIVTNLYRYSIGNIKIKNFKNKKINNFKKLFNVKLISLNIEDLYNILNKKEIFKNKYCNINTNILFMFKKQIIAYGLIEFGVFRFTKIFNPQLEAIIKKNKGDCNDKI